MDRPRGEFGLFVQKTPVECSAESATECEVCGYSGKRPSVDHCHSTGLARGAICGRCNTALGMTDDSPETLRALADYLERWREIHGQGTVQAKKDRHLAGEGDADE